MLWAEGWSVQNKYANVQRTEHGRYDRVLRLGQLTPIQTQGEASQMAPSPESTEVTGMGPDTSHRTGKAY